MKRTLQLSALFRLWRQVLPLAALLALISSSQYLFQPFVWRHWPVDTVLLGWIEILGDRLLVAGSVATAVIVALSLPLQGRVARGTALALAIVAGAAGGEALLHTLGLPGAPAAVADAAQNTLRWSVFAAGIVGLWVAWSRALAADAAVRDAAQAKAAAERQLTALRVQALQAQIEPHFLFNTLATVKRLSSVEPARCQQLLAHLHTFVRLSQAAQPGQLRWTLSEEIELARAYLSVVEMRMDGRLRVTIDIEAALGNFDIPPLVLATLVENAVKHGSRHRLVTARLLCAPAATVTPSSCVSPTLAPAFTAAVARVSVWPTHARACARTTATRRPWNSALIGPRVWWQPCVCRRRQLHEQ